MKTVGVRGTRIASCLFALLTICGVAHTQEAYPTKPVRIIVPFPAGGAVDIIGRELGQRLSTAWQQQVLIDNRGGANGAIGSEAVAKAKPDGYVLLMGSAGTHAINPGLHSKLAYDAIEDFVAVALVADLTNVLVVYPPLEANSVSALIALAKAKPGALTYASSGNGSSQHLSTELFKSMTGTDITHVQYKGAGPALTDVIGGQVSMTITAMSATLSAIQAGRLRALGVTTARRSPTLPQVPTIAEAGVPGYESNNWVGMFAPAGTSADIVSRLNADIARLQTTAEMQARLQSLGAEFVPNTPAQFAAFQRAEIAKWGKVIKESGARID